MTTETTAAGAGRADAGPRLALGGLVARFLGRHQYVACVGLFYLYMLVPARVQEMLAVFRLAAPPAAIAFGLGYPSFTILDLAMLTLGGVVLASSPRRRTRGTTNWSLIIYVSLCVLCAAAAWVFYQLGVVPAPYGDSVLSALRVLAASVLFAATPGDSRVQARHLQNALALLFLTSFALNLAGFANTATSSNEAGRLNVAGLDFTTTSYFGCVLALSALTRSRGVRLLVLFGAGLLGVGMGGSRNAVALFIPALALVTLQRYTLRRQTIAAFSAAAVVLLPLALGAPLVIGKLPLVNRSLDDVVYYRTPQVLSPLALSTFPGVGRLSVTEPAIIGRINTWASGIELLRRSSGVPLGSDWTVQQGLAPLGVPSHAHSGYLQTALKFSLLAVFLWASWVWAAWSGLRVRSPHSAIIVFLLVSLLFDYWLLVTKATFLLFAFIRLDHLWRAGHAAPAAARAPAGALAP